MRADTLHKSVCKESAPRCHDNAVELYSYLLLIFLAISLFLFLSQKVVVLLEVQVDLLADPIVPIRKANKDSVVQHTLYAGVWMCARSSRICGRSEVLRKTTRK